MTSKKLIEDFEKVMIQ